MKMRILISLLALTCLVAEVDISKDKYIFQEFNKFMKQYNKTYGNLEEFLTRFENFKTNIIRIEKLTAEKETSYSVGITKFSDETKEEFSKRLGFKVDQSTFKKSEPLGLKDAPAAFDWRDKGVVGPIKDQGDCGSCWAFSVIGNLESQYAIKKGQSPVQLSEEQLVDCDTVDQGCNGGIPESAYQYIEKQGGVESQKDYPYTMGGKCQFDSKKIVLKVLKHTIKNVMDEKDQKEWLFANGPLSIGINADPLQEYTGGIVDADESSCNPTQLDHGVVLVGYGSENGQDFWIIKNSWGESWGEKGYFRMSRGKGTCGVNQYVSTGEISLP
jgi:cathepsin F